MLGSHTHPFLPKLAGTVPECTGRRAEEVAGPEFPGFLLTEPNLKSLESEQGPPSTELCPHSRAAPELTLDRGPACCRWLKGREYTGGKRLSSI